MIPLTVLLFSSTIIVISKNEAEGVSILEDMISVRMRIIIDK